MSVKVAVIEDSPDNRLLIQVFLEEHFAVQEYESGMEALEHMPQHPPDLILMDISLPEIDGVEVLKRLKQLPILGDLPVVALTAHAMRGDREKFLALGFDAYISKPIWDEYILLDTINGLIASRGSA